MKMRTKSRIYAVLAFFVIAAALCGCKEELASDPGFEVNKDRIEVPVEGGTFEVGYTVANPVPDGSIRPVSERNWVHDINVSDDRIEFTVDENTAFEPRESRVELLYTGGNVRRYFTVSQSAAEEYVFKIDIKEIGETEVYASVQPADAEMTYVVMTVTESDWESINESEEILFANIVSQFEYNADMYKLTLAEYLDDFDVLKTGYSEVRLSGFQVATDYLLFAVGMSLEGDQLSEIVLSPFTTKDVEKQDMTFSIDVAVEGGYRALTTVSPSDENVYYIATVTQCSYWGEGMSMEEIAQNVMEGEISTGGSYGKTRNQVVEEMRVKGEYVRRDTLMQNQAFYALAFTVTDDGYVNSEVECEEFSTGDVPLSSNTFTISVSGIGLDMADISVETANNDSYVCVVEPLFEWEGMSDDEILSGIQEEYYEQEYMHNGNIGFTQTRLMSGIEYAVYVFGYEVPTYVGAVTTRLYKKTFTTLASDSYDDLSFTWDFLNVKDRSVEVSITADPETVLYYYGIAPADYTEDMIRSEIDLLIEEEIYNSFMTKVYDAGDFMRKYGVRGDAGKTFDGLYPGSAYKVYCVGVSDRTGAYMTPFYYSDTVMTDDAEESGLTIELMYDEYYDGTEVAKLYPDLIMAAGYAILPVDVRIEGGDASGWWFHIYAADITDKTAYTDDWLIQYLLENGVDSQYSSRLFFCPWDEDITMIAVAKDKEGLYSNVFRKKINLTESGAAPAEDFVMPNMVLYSQNAIILR